MARTLPMFPLTNVVFPYMLLPLHVFEERYRRLMIDLRADESPEFGVVLIERGSEVGGGEQRSDLGTVVKVLDSEELPDGRWVAVTAGTGRIRVTKWLPDGPYPVASVEEVKDLEPGEAGETLRESVQWLLRKVGALLAESGEVGPPVDLELSGDVTVASYQACAVAPLGPLDSQRLLVFDDPVSRLKALGTLLHDQMGILELRLAQG